MKGKQGGSKRSNTHNSGDTGTCRTPDLPSTTNQPSRILDRFRLATSDKRRPQSRTVKNMTLSLVSTPAAINRSTSSVVKIRGRPLPRGNRPNPLHGFGSPCRSPAQAKNVLRHFRKSSRLSVPKPGSSKTTNNSSVSQGSSGQCSVNRASAHLHCRMVDAFKPRALHSAK